MSEEVTKDEDGFDIFIKRRFMVARCGWKETQPPVIRWFRISPEGNLPSAVRRLAGPRLPRPGRDRPAIPGSGRQPLRTGASPRARHRPLQVGSFLREIENRQLQCGNRPDGDIYCYRHAHDPDPKEGRVDGHRHLQNGGPD